MIPDSYKKTVRIPVIMTKNDLKFFYGGDLPAIKEGTIAELVVPEYSILDGFKLSMIKKDFIKPFLAKDTILMARLSERSVDESKQFLTRIKIFPPGVGLFSEIVIDEDLKISFRGTKSPELLDCKCKIPALKNEQAKSVNHAFTLISEKFEKHRRSHTGNVFEQVYYNRSPDGWVRLKERRNQLIREYEYELFCLCRRWWYKTELNNQMMWGCFDQKGKSEFTVYNISMDSEILSEHYFRNDEETINWFNKNSYIEFNIQKSSELIIPPFPPYKKQDGIEVLLEYHIGK